MLTFLLKFLSILFFYFFYFIFFFFFFFNDTATTEIYTLSLHDALPIYLRLPGRRDQGRDPCPVGRDRSEEHTSELQSRGHLVCRLLLEKKKKNLNAHLLLYKKKKKKKKETNTNNN